MADNYLGLVKTGGVVRVQPVVILAGESISSVIELGPNERITGISVVGTADVGDLQFEGRTGEAQGKIVDPSGATLSIRPIMSCKTSIPKEMSELIYHRMLCLRSTWDGANLTMPSDTLIYVISEGAETEDPTSLLRITLPTDTMIKMGVDSAGAVIWTLPDETVYYGASYEGPVTAGVMTIRANWKTESADGSLGAKITIENALTAPQLPEDPPMLHPVIDLGDIPTGVAVLSIDGATLTGRFADLPETLFDLTISNTVNTTMESSIDELPDGLSSLWLWQTNGCRLSGDIGRLPRGLTCLYMNDIGTSSSLDGALETLPDGLTMLYLNLVGSICRVKGSIASLPVSLVDGVVLAWLGSGVHGVLGELHPLASSFELHDCGFSPAETDEILIALDDRGPEVGEATLDDQRTEASDDAVASLTAKGWTLTFV